jgi:hypothetical protein
VKVSSYGTNRSGILRHDHYPGSTRGLEDLGVGGPLRLKVTDRHALQGQGRPHPCGQRGREPDEELHRVSAWHMRSSLMLIERPIRGEPDRAGFARELGSSAGDSGGAVLFPRFWQSQGGWVRLSTESRPLLRMRRFVAAAAERRGGHGRSEATDAAARRKDAKGTTQGPR